MAVLKYYDGSDWEPVASALVGPTGPTGVAGATGATGATGPTAGMVLLNTTSFSAVASQSINDVFSATYDNYRIIFEGNASNTTTGFNFRLRVGGSDDTNSVYGKQSLNVDGSSASAARSAAANTLALADLISTDKDFYHIELINPNKVAPTGYDFSFTRRYNNSSNIAKLFIAGGHTNSTLFDGFTFYVGGVGITFAGTISVYGYNK